MNNMPGPFSLFRRIARRADGKSRPPASPALKPESRFNKADIAMLAVFILLGYFIRKALFVGMAYSDDYDYAQIAVMICDGRYNPVDIGRMNLYGWRFAMVFPLALCFKIFGSTSENIAALWPLIASLGTAAVLYPIGAKLFDSRTGLIAAILHLLYPADIHFGTTVLTETPFNFLIALSMLFFVIGEDSRHWYVQSMWFLLCGSMTTWLLYGRPYGIMILAAYGAFMVVRHRIRLNYLFIIAGTALTLAAIEYAVHAHTGTWFENFKVMKRMIDPMFTPVSNYSQHLDFYRQTLFNNRMHLPHFYIFIMGFGVLFNWMRFSPSFSAEKLSPEADRRYREHGYLILFWMASILLYIEFGFQNLEHLTLMHKLDRYLVIVTAPICLGAAPFLARFTNRYAIAITAVMFCALAAWWYMAVLPPDLRPMIRFP